MKTVQSIESNLSRPFISSSPTNGKGSEMENWLAKNPYEWRLRIFFAKILKNVS